MVVRIRDSEFMALGLERAGFIRWKNHNYKTNLEHFKGWYGASPKSCELIWVDLQTTIEEEFRIDSDANPSHLLLTLHFLKSFQTELILAPTFRVTEKTARKWIGVYMAKLQLLKIHKVCTRYTIHDRRSPKNKSQAQMNLERQAVYSVHQLN